MVEYHLGNLDVDEFARSWLKMLDSDEASMKTLRGRTDRDRDLGPHFMMANIGPRAVEHDASSAELVLYAVLAVYQNDDYPGRNGDSWAGPTGHLDAAFAYANALGRPGVATSLITAVARRSQRERQPLWRPDSQLSSTETSARMAAHDQEMAHITSRDTRAALLLDPMISIETILLGTDS